MRRTDTPKQVAGPPKRAHVGVSCADSGEKAERVDVTRRRQFDPIWRPPCAQQQFAITSLASRATWTGSSSEHLTPTTVSKPSNRLPADTRHPCRPPRYRLPAFKPPPASDRPGHPGRAWGFPATSAAADRRLVRARVGDRLAGEFPITTFSGLTNSLGLPMLDGPDR